MVLPVLEKVYNVVERCTCVIPISCGSSRSAAGEMFGAERMTDALNSCADGTPEEILRTVKNAVDAFVGDAEPFDDLTMMCMEYKGPLIPVL